MHLVLSGIVQRHLDRTERSDPPSVEDLVEDPDLPGSVED